jgi:hypothetical protein
LGEVVVRRHRGELGIVCVLLVVLLVVITVDAIYGDLFPFVGGGGHHRELGNVRVRFLVGELVRFFLVNT